MLTLNDAALRPPAFAVDMFDRAVAAAALEARELRLLAQAVGDHLPIELAIEVAELRARRAALG